MNHPGGRDDGRVAAGALDVGRSERHQRVGLRHLARDAVESAVLEDQHRIGVADRGLEQAAGVGRRGRDADLEAGCVDEPRLHRVRVMPAARAPDPVRHPERHGAGELAAEHVPRLGDLVDDLVHGARDEVGEVHVDDRHEAGDGRAQRRADDGRLRDRRVQHALGAELVHEPLRHAERQAEHDVLTDAVHARIAAHLLAKREVQRVADVEQRHASVPSTNSCE